MDSCYSDKNLIGAFLLGGKTNWFDSTTEAM